MSASGHRLSKKAVTSSGELKPGSAFGGYLATISDWTNIGAQFID
jgi:hypothetical protein